MKRSIIWAPKARKDLRSLFDHIAAENRQAAELVSDRIRDAISLLSLRPIGRPGRVQGTFEKSAAKTSHIIVYRLKAADMLEIVRIIHMARDWRPGTWPRDDREES